MTKKKILSVFVDESGILSPTDATSRFYIVTALLHNQDLDITHAIHALDRDLDNIGIANLCFHAAPIIRANGGFEFMNWDLRRKIFSRVMGFSRRIDFKYHCFWVDKKFVNSTEDIISRLQAQFQTWLEEHSDDLGRFESIKVYYDCGQTPITLLLHDCFKLLNHIPVIFAEAVEPRKYKLLQLADLVCTIKLLELKLTAGIGLALVENRFFGGAKRFKHNILRPIRSKEI